MIQILLKYEKDDLQRFILWPAPIKKNFLEFRYEEGDFLFSALKEEIRDWLYKNDISIIESCEIESYPSQFYRVSKGSIWTYVSPFTVSSYILKFTDRNEEILFKLTWM